MSDSHTLPAASPLSFVAVGDYENAAFGVNPTGLNSAAAGLPCSPASQLMPPPPPPPYKTTHHTSPKPERRVKPGSGGNGGSEGYGASAAAGGTGGTLSENAVSVSASVDPGRKGSQTSVMIRSCPPQVRLLEKKMYVLNCCI